MWRFGTLQVPHQVRAAALRGVNLRDVLVYMVSEVHALPKRGTFITLDNRSSYCEQRSNAPSRMRLFVKAHSSRLILWSMRALQC